VGDSFSPTMLRVVQLYDFEGGGTVPDDAKLARAVRAAQAFETRTVSVAVEGRFADTGALLADPKPAYSSFAAPAAGLDFSGAAKGLALDAALAVMQDAAEKGALDGALISAGSTTLVAGRKPTAEDAQPWHVGIEDPRDPQRIIGVVDYVPAETTATAGELPFGTVSTSGDYQQSFVRDGVRYHHILDPATGKPAREMRSLTVVGAATGIDSDILSTALFVMGVPRAEAYAREQGLGLFIVDAEGRTRIVPGPEGAAWKIRLGSK
jgi:thiamine biosynthesis lipoprotein